MSAQLQSIVEMIEQIKAKISEHTARGEDVSNLEKELRVLNNKLNEANELLENKKVLKG